MGRRRVGSHSTTVNLFSIPTPAAQRDATLKQVRPKPGAGVTRC
jgi:hypothetical protein